MAKRRINGLGLVGGLVGGAVGGLGAALLVGLVVNEIGEARRRQQEQQRVRDAQLFVLHAIGQVARLFGDGTWMPAVEFDAGCPNAHWDSNLQRICVNTAWALEQFTASCNSRECTWNRTPPDATKKERPHRV